MNPASNTRRITPHFLPKIWGSSRLGPWFEPRGEELTGEVWFPAGELLIKFLFTSDNLSVQVHPDEEYALLHENSHGKNEMWHILRADPGAQIALGFKRQYSTDQVIAAAKSGEIMHQLNWFEVSAGQTWFIPAGTVHAIGAGLALCEIQQNSDVTYRLFDYGRDRELHLRQAADVLIPGPYREASQPSEDHDGLRFLAGCRWFQTYSAVVNRPQVIPQKGDSWRGARFLVVLEGQGSVNGLRAEPGQVFDAGELHPWKVEPDPSTGSGSMKLLLVG